MSDTLTLIEKTVFLKSVEVFAVIPTEPLGQLAAHTTEAQFDPGETLFRERDQADGIFVVVDGSIELRQGDVVVRVLDAGAVHGELFLEENACYEYTATARSESRVLKLARGHVFDALLEYPEFGLAVVMELARRHQQLVARVIELEHEKESGVTATPARTESAIEPPAPAPELPKRRGWWRLASRPAAGK